jgi:hypothetical protein
MDISGDADGGGGGGGEDRYSLAEETVTISHLNESGGGRESSKFLFIHTTGDSAAYKHGNCPEIRSHVTARARREFKEIHKTARQGKRKAIRSKNHSLGPQPHDSNRPASMTVALSPRASLTFSIPGNDVLVSGTKELHTGQEALPQDTKVADVDLPPFDLAGDSLNADTRNVSEQRKASESYCKACGRPVEGEGYLIQAFPKLINVAREYSRQESAIHSPIELLGAGRVDPFSSYPMKLNDKGNELLDHRKFVSPLNFIHAILYFTSPTHNMQLIRFQWSLTRYPGFSPRTSRLVR